MTDNIAHYFNKLPAITKPSALPIADTIGFYGNFFPLRALPPNHHRPTGAGQGCTLVINDRVFKPFLDEMLETLKASTIRSSKECAYLKCRHTVSG